MLRYKLSTPLLSFLPHVIRFSFCNSHVTNIYFCFFNYIFVPVFILLLFSILCFFFHVIDRIGTNLDGVSFKYFVKLLWMIELFVYKLHFFAYICINTFILWCNFYFNFLFWFSNIFLFRLESNMTEYYFLLFFELK